MTESTTPHPAAVPDGGFNAEMVITVAAPVRDEDIGIIEGFLQDTQAVLERSFTYYEILLVDHGVTEALAHEVERLQERIPNVRLVRLSRAYDEQIAFFAALDCSIGDYVVLMEINSDPPQRIPDLVRTCSTGYDAVIGKTQAKREASLFRRAASVTFYRILEMMTGQAIDPNSTNFRAFSRRIVNSIVRIKDKNLYMKYLTEYVGYRQTLLPYERITRGARERAHTFTRSAGRALDIIIANSNKPLRIAAFVGVAASFVNLAYVVFVLFIALLQERVEGIDAAQGWASTNLFNAVMFFLLFLMLAVLSEYVLKILQEAQARPLYHVAYESNSSVVDRFRQSSNVV